MPRKPKSETSTPPATPSLLDAFKTPSGVSECDRGCRRQGDRLEAGPPPVPPAAVDEIARRLQENLSDLETAVRDAVPETASKEDLDRAVGLVPLTPPLPRAVEILFDIALEVPERETNVPVRLDAAAEIMAWLDSLGSVRPSYDVPRVGALRVFLEHVAEYKVRCEPKERVRAAALILKMG